MDLLKQWDEHWSTRRIFYEFLETPSGWTTIAVASKRLRCFYNEKFIIPYNQSILDAKGSGG